GVHLAVAALMLFLWPPLIEFIANIVAFCVPFQVSLVGHRRLTFKRQRSAWRFALVAASGIALNNGLLA
ncbi:GtrA family protein, partial [Cobetia marina]